MDRLKVRGGHSVKQRNVANLWVSFPRAGGIIWHIRERVVEIMLVMICTLVAMCTLPACHMHQDLSCLVEKRQSICHFLSINSSELEKYRYFNYLSGGFKLFTRDLW